MTFDGSKNVEGAGAGVILISPKGDKLHYALWINFTPCTKNVAEYETLIHGMRATKEMRLSRLRCYGDFDLVANQISGTCNTHSLKMIAYHKAVDQLGGHFVGYSVQWIERNKNEEADDLSRIGSSLQPPPLGVFLDIIHKPLVSPPKKIDIAVPLAPNSTLVAMAVDTSDWTAPYIAYLAHQVLPQDEMEARMIQRRRKSFFMINNELYKHSVSGIFQRCVSLEDGRNILYNIHARD
jgi:ribonuclease HI